MAFYRIKKNVPYFKMIEALETILGHIAHRLKIDLSIYSDVFEEVAPIVYEVVYEETSTQVNVDADTIGGKNLFELFSQFMETYTISLQNQSSFTLQWEYNNNIDITLLIFCNGILLNPNTDYIRSGNNINLTRIVNGRYTIIRIRKP